MVIESRAPTRIDLAGGTVDIWPLYLFLHEPVTLNLAIDLFAEARLEERRDDRVHLRSEDQGAELSFAWNELEQVTAPPALELHLKLLRHYARPALRAGTLVRDTGLRFQTVARSPAGAWLGGSSSLCVALIGAIARWSKGAVDPAREGEKLIDLTRDTETTVIRVPAGLQDYYAAMFGGLQALRWRPGSHERDRLPVSVLEGLERRLLLFYSGQSRNSGINNWALFKAFIDGQGPVREQFAGIARATTQAEQALRDSDWVGAGEAIAAEWAIRRTLTSGISTPEMDAAFAAAKPLGGVSGKVCGAGGGGCFFVYFPSGDPEERDRIQTAVTRIGLRPLPFRAVPDGLSVKAVG
jgi:D-glycero-alpha-D-manno-heptose-7-phosphate kinase